MSRDLVCGWAAIAALVLSFSVSADIAPPPNRCDTDPTLRECDRGGSTVKPFEEYDKRLRAGEIVSPLGSAIFGDSTSLYNGATEFSIVDIDLAGNGDLPVQLRRRFKVDSKKTYQSLGGFGSWEIDVPYIMGNFDSFNKWNTGSGGAANRCSQAWQPDYPPGTGFDIKDFYSGIHLHIPGEGEREILYSQNAGNPMPIGGETYRWSTRDDFRFTCTDIINGYGGLDYNEGFLAVDRNGTKYYFDVGLERNNGHVRRGPWVHSRTRVYLMASRVVDRFGNSVDYHYSGVGPGAHLTEISASDGRSITLEYFPSSGYTRIENARAHGRTWHYDYRAAPGYSAGPEHPIEHVNLPDGSRWSYEYSGTLHPTFFGDEETNGCPPGLANEENFTLTAIHPAGASNRFEFFNRTHYRSGIPTTSCYQDPNSNVWILDLANYFSTFSLVEKTINGPGLTPMTWSFDYGMVSPQRYGSAIPCTNDIACQLSKTVEVTQPDLSTVEYDFGVRFWWNEGRLLKTTTKTSAGDVLRSETNTYVTNAEAASMPFPNSIGTLTASDDWTTAWIRPIKSTVINQQSTNFGNTVNTFDNFARPLSVTKASPFGTKTEITSYSDHLPTWVVGQVASVQVGTKFPVQNSYDPNSALLTLRRAFGKVLERRTYHADGLPWQIYDGSEVKKTTLSSYKRGIPRTVVYHDSSIESADVNDHGEITSVIDAMNHETLYEYDPMGRLKLIKYPTGDTVGWNDTIINFERVSSCIPASICYGLPPGHWRQTVRTGNGYTVNYFDGLWRPVLTRTYDSANELATRRMVQRRFDHANRETLVSYPKRTIDTYTIAVDGMASEYDALGRVTVTKANSELGVLTTTFNYITQFRTQVTDPKLNTTTTSFQAFDQPSTDAPRLVQYPTGASTTISRDLFGKPNHIQRSGVWDGSTLSADRRFVYDANERLCKTYDPEAGWTVVDYDASNNLAWTTTGSSLSSLTDCQRGSVAAADKSSRSYDGRNRLLVLDHPSGTDDITHTYFADGALKTIATPNGGTWTYAYNKRRLLTSEKLAINGSNFNLAWTYNANGHVNYLTYPNGAAIFYGANALGEPSAAFGNLINYASNVKYHPNGHISEFTYGNDIVHDTTQNVRGNVEISRDEFLGSRYVYYSHIYDKNGNLVARSDGTSGNVESRIMDYDGLDRLIYTDAPAVLGTATYTYDPLNNLRQIDFEGGARLGQTDTYRYNSSNRLYEIYRLREDNAQETVPYGYDIRGNITQRSAPAQNHTYDRANRMLTGGTESYRYDGHGRRTLVTRNGGTTVQLYSRNGQLVFEREIPNFFLGFDTIYVHLGDRLVATDLDTGGAPTYAHVDTLGTVVRRTDSNRNQINRIIYEPYGSIAAGGYLQGPGFTGHVTDAATKLSYMQQRYYDSTAMRFLSVDPVPVGTADGSNFNRYWYANNNPYKYVDPDGRYGRGTGFSDREWKTFDRAQQQAAGQIEKAAERITQALGTGEGMKSVTSAFEKSFGEGSATPENMAKVASTLSGMAGALRDDGSAGFVANKDTSIGSLAASVRGTKTILVNPSNERFTSGSILKHAVGHESAHSVGMRDQRMNGVTAYKYGTLDQKRSFSGLPGDQRLINPDHLMDFD